MEKGNIDALLGLVDESVQHAHTSVEYLKAIEMGVVGGASELTLKDLVERVELLADQNTLVLKTIGEPCDAPWDGKRVDASLVSLLKRLCLEKVCQSP